MNRTPSDKFILLFEAVKRSLLAADAFLKRLSDELSSLESDISASIEVGERAIPPLMSAVAFIDFAHRFASIADALPLINKSAPEMRRLKKAMAPVEKVRNHLQHMRGDLSSNAPVTYPLLGALAWANGSSSFAVLLSQPTNATASSLVYDSVRAAWIPQRQYTVKNVDIDLDGVLMEMHAVYSWITSIVQFSDPSIAELSWGKTQSLGFHIVVPAELTQQSVSADRSASASLRL